MAMPIARHGAWLVPGLSIVLFAGSAHSEQLPSWDILALCGNDSARGQCILLEREALRTISGGWDALPPKFRDACLGSVTSPYDKSYRLLSSCIEGQVLKGLDKEVIDTAVTAAAATQPKPPAKLADANEPRTAPAATPTPAAAAPTEAHRFPWPYLDPADASVTDEAKRRLAISAELATATKAREAAESEDAKAAAAAVAAAPPAAALATAIAWPYVDPASASVAEEAQRRAAVAAALLAATKAREAAEAADAKAAAAAVAAAPPAAAPATAIAWPYVDPASASVAEEAQRRAAVAAELLAAAKARAAAEAELAQAATAAPKPAESVTQPHPFPWPYIDPADASVAEEAQRRAAIAAELAAATKARETAEAENAAAATAAKNAVVWPYIDPADASVAEEAKRRAAVAAELLAAAKAREATELEAARIRAAAAACQTALDAAARSGVILFRSSSATLDPKSTATLDRLATAARSCNQVRIRIAGHTDATGAENRNQTLSEDRARAVAGYLTDKGVEQGRLESTGFGETKPIASNDTSEGRARNRRIEFTVVTE